VPRPLPRVRRSNIGEASVGKGGHRSHVEYCAVIYNRAFLSVCSAHSAHDPLLTCCSLQSEGARPWLGESRTAVGCQVEHLILYGTASDILKNCCQNRGAQNIRRFLAENRSSYLISFGPAFHVPPFLWPSISCAWDGAWESPHGSIDFAVFRIGRLLEHILSRVLHGRTLTTGLHGAYVMLVHNFGHESDATSLEDAITSRPSVSTTLS